MYQAPGNIEYGSQELPALQWAAFLSFAANVKCLKARWRDRCIAIDGENYSPMNDYSVVDNLLWFHASMVQCNSASVDASIKRGLMLSGTLTMATARARDGYCTAAGVLFEQMNDRSFRRARGSDGGALRESRLLDTCAQQAPRLRMTGFAQPEGR